MNKERLEQMEKLLNDYYDNLDDPFATTDIAIAVIEKAGWLIKYAKEQAERVQELEIDVERAENKSKHFKKEHSELAGVGEMWINVSNKLIKTEQQNKQYRKVIKSMKSEINYALQSHKSKDVKRFYLENAVRDAEEALEETE